MQTAQITRYAHALYRAHGGQAEADAARRERNEQASGDTEAADTWRKIRNLIRALR